MKALRVGSKRSLCSMHAWVSSTGESCRSRIDRLTSEMVVFKRSAPVITYPPRNLRPFRWA